MSINRMYYGTKKIYSFLENGNTGGDCNCEQEYQNGYNQGFQDGQNSVECPEGGSCNLGEGEIYLTANDAGFYELYAADDGYDGWSKFYVTLENGGAIKIRKASDLLDAFNNGESFDYGAYYYVGGKITEIQEINTQYGNATYILDNGFKVYRGKWMDGVPFDYEDQIKVGAYIAVYGIIQNYNGTLQFKAGSQVIAYQECEGGGSSNPFAEYGYNEEDVTNISSLNKGNSLAKLNEWDSSRDSAIEYFIEDEYETPAHQRLVFAPMLDTSNVTNMSRMFKGTANLVYVPTYDTSKVVSMRGMFERSGIMFIPKFDTSNVQDVIGFCAETTRLVSLPKFDFSNVTEIGEFFGYWNTVMSLVNLGGFEGLKIDWNDGYGLNNCPYLTYESIMNVINGLYDFRGNGDNDTIKALKIHTNTMALLSDEDKQIAINKGWMLTE